MTDKTDPAPAPSLRAQILDCLSDVTSHCEAAEKQARRRHADADAFELLRAIKRLSDAICIMLDDRTL